MAPVLISVTFYLVLCVLPTQCLFETSKFVKKDVCANHFIQLDKPARKMLASICETQCMIVCHETEGCSISKCENKSYCVLGKYDCINNFGMDDCTATEKMWVSYEAYENRNCKTRFTLHSDKGYCLSKEGKSLAGCKASDIESRNDCGVACNILESCIAINYNIEFQNCLLITTSKPDNGCPTGFTWLNRVFAKSVDDLKVWPQANTVCYAKIQG